MFSENWGESIYYAPKNQDPGNEEHVFQRLVEARM